MDKLTSHRGRIEPVAAHDLQNLFKRLAAAEQELAATRAELAIARETSEIRHYRHRGRLVAKVAGGFISVIALAYPCFFGPEVKTEVQIAVEKYTRHACGAYAIATSSS